MKLRKEQLLTVAIIGVILVTFVTVIYVPQRRELTQLKQEYQSAAQALQRDKNKALELAQLRGEVKQMTDRLAFFNQRLPDDQELGEFVGTASRNALVAGLTDMKYMPKGVVQDELYLRRPIEMTCTGRFADLFAFLLKLKDLPRLTHVQSLNLTNDAKLTGDCTIKMEMMIYFTRG